MRIASVLNLLCVMLCTVSTARANIIYQLVDYGAPYGLTLSGTMTTDGTLGAISESNILSWDFSVSGDPDGVFGGASTDLTGANTLLTSGAPIDVTATATELTVLSGSFGFGEDEHGGRPQYRRNAADGRPFFFDANSNYTSAAPITTYVFANAGAPVSVPEPSTFAFLSLGAFAMGMVRYRRRKCQAH